MITAFVWIPMEGPWVPGTSGGGCHVRRDPAASQCTAFPGDCGEWPMGHWWSRHSCEFQWRVCESVARQGGGCHVRRDPPVSHCTAFPGDSGEWPMGHWWSWHSCEFQWRVVRSGAFQGREISVFWHVTSPLTTFVEYICRIGFSIKMHVERYLDEPRGTSGTIKTRRRWRNFVT